MHSATDTSSAFGLTTQQGSTPNSLSPQSQQPPSVFGANRTPPLAFSPSLHPSSHTPASPNTLSQSSRVNTPTINQFSSSSPKSSLSMSRDSLHSQNLLARAQNQLSLTMPSPRTSPLSQAPISSMDSSDSLPTLDSSSTLSSASPMIPTPTALSPAAPQFQMKSRLLDAPINIHALQLARPDDDLERRARTSSGGISGSDVLSLTSALMNEGPTPTQESFKPLQVFNHPADVASPSITPASGHSISPFGPPNPTTHIIEIDDSPIPPSELSPQTLSCTEPSSLVTGVDRISLSLYQPSATQVLPHDTAATDAPSCQKTLEDDFRTPNVYINGLPPNFPEDQLLAMTREFGEVISVRTFTRHVSDRPSGYGFVLFGDVNAAEKCIESLRKYRNLHPSYSKRIHKIPGTTYASAHADKPALSTASDTSSNAGSESDSFKARMERLHDTSSTNLYMEGLPMDINEPTLAALVSPYKIMSSRFFQTRLSVPARVIAFVRLETRTAAEEVVERLHGRMVRGWADAGCRISVRFADTSEQRELRRMERMNREGEQSPSRITVAQAALLNLKGGQLQTSPGMGMSSLPRLSPPFVGSTLPSMSGRSPNFPPIALRSSASSTLTSLSPLTYGPVPGQGSVVFGQNDSFHAQHHPQIMNRRMTPSPISFQHPLNSERQQAQLTQHLPVIGQGNIVNSDLSSYLPHDELLNTRLSGISGATLINLPHLSTYDDTLVLPDVAGGGLRDASGVAARAQNGYTTLERDILQKYLQRQQSQQQVSLSEQSGLSRVGSGFGAVGKSGSSLLGRRLMDTLPSLSEEDFHAQGGRKAANSKAGVSVHLAPVPQPKPPSLPPSRLAMDDANAKLNFTRQRNQTHSSGLALSSRINGVSGEGMHAIGAEERTRSTTMPEEYLGRRNLYSGNAFLGFSVSPIDGCSMTAYNKTNNRTKYDFQASHSNTDSSIDSNTLIRSGIQHNDSSSSNVNTRKHDDRPHNNDTNINLITRDTSSSHAIQPDQTACNTADSNTEHTTTRIDTTPSTLHAAVATDLHSSTRTNPTSFHARGSSGSDGNVSPLDSPALTYSNSARTPATLSPATPFSAFPEGSFDPGVVVNTRDETNTKGEVGLGVSLNVAGKERPNRKTSVVAITPTSNTEGEQGRATVEVAAGRPATQT